MKSARKSTVRRRVTRRAVPLSLSARVERLEKAVLFKDPPTVARAQRFTRLLANGHPFLDPQDGEHVVTFDAKTGLYWSAEPLQGGKDFNHADAIQACKEYRGLGYSDWRAPTIEELLSIVDYTRIEPVVDTDHFKGPYGYTWSSTVAVAPAGFAWYVFLPYGSSNRFNQSSRNRVRAVRSGQQLGLLG